MENNALAGGPYSIGYVLSGGFIRGFTRLGATQALLKHNIRLDIISEVGAEVLAGVFYADGDGSYRVLDYFPRYESQGLTKPVIPKVGLFALGEFMDFLKSDLKTQKLEDLKLPLIIIATDLDHGCSTHFHKGDMAGRVVASCCMPVLFTSVEIGDTHYVDGGLLMNLSVSTIRNECEEVMMVNVSPLMAEKYKMNTVSIAMHSYHFMLCTDTFPGRDNCDLLVKPCNLKSYNNTESEETEEIFEQGCNTASEALDQLIEEREKI